MSVEVDVWYVKLADGDVERVTLDQLDEAFQNGQIDENSMVLAAGTDQWMKLSQLLQQSEAAPPAPAPMPASPQATQWPAPTPQVAPQVYAAPPAAMARPASPVAVQPLTTVPPPSARPNVPVASTLRPLTFDIGADDPDISFPRAPSRKGRVIAAVGAVAVLGAAAFVVANRSASSASSGSSAPAFAAAAALPPIAPPPPAQPATPAPSPPVQPYNGGSSSVMDPTRMDSTQHLTDAQKQKLLEADKKKPHERGHGGGGGAVSHSAPVAKGKSSPAFTTSGNKFDPLNSSL